MQGTMEGASFGWTDVTPEAGSRLMMAAKCWALKSAAMLFIVAPTVNDSMNLLQSGKGRGFMLHPHYDGG